MVTTFFGKLYTFRRRLGVIDSEALGFFGIRVIKVALRLFSNLPQS